MKEKRIIKKHVLADRIPLILAMVLMMVCQYLPSVVVATALDPFYDYFSGTNTLFLIFCIIAILFSILLVIIFERWFYPEYEGSLKLRGFGRGMLVSLPVIVFIVAYRIFKSAVGFEMLHKLELLSVLQGLRAGVSEEAAFRAIAVALLLRTFRNEKNIWIPAVFTGVFFGCTHLLNVFSGDEFANVAVNAVFASSVGIILGVIFTFSGNIWPVVFVHSLYDTLFFIAEDLDMPVSVVYAEVGIFLLIMVAYLLALHRRRKSLAAFWDTKWKNPLPGEATAN